MSSRTVGLLNAYADLIAYAAAANRGYADSIGLHFGDASYLGQLLDESDDMTMRSRCPSGTSGSEG